MVYLKNPTKLLFLIFTIQFFIQGCLSVRKGENQDNNDINLLNGDKIISNMDHSVVKKGEFVEGFKNDLWLYIIDSSSFEIDWKKISFNKKLTMNIPANCELDNTSGMSIGLGEVAKDSNQIVIIQNTDFLKNDSLSGYANILISELNEFQDVLESKIDLFLNNGRSFYLMQGTFLKNSKVYTCYSMVTEVENSILEITYYHKSKDWKIHYNVFLDLVNGVNYSGEFLTNHEDEVYNPWSFVKVIEE